MARQPRREEPGATYHVAARGSSGRAIFGDVRDRLRFLDLLGRVTEDHRWIVLAHCLMTNHVHLLVTIPDGGLSAGMQRLLTAYSRTTNRRYGQRDHLFRQHFFSVKLERQEHLLESARYIVLNPVRAGLCSRPDDWAWSSYCACAGLGFAPRFLAVDELLRLFGPRPLGARRRYREFVASAHDAVSDTVTEA
jgi:REP element-mobilizing transposase RayT